ncbi:MAG: hypothetical protein IJZ82_03040 [Lachnospiraceae bacterium]|nr:hypothetical protein [Lachnospiraceae bacterium]
MKKKIVVVSAILAAVLIGIIVLICMPRDNYMVDMETDIIVKDGVAQSEPMEYVIVLPKDGEYVMYVDWKINPLGMLMGCSFRDESGKDINTFTAHWITMQSHPLELEAGKYTMTLTPITNSEQWRDYFADVDTSDWDVPPEEMESPMKLLADGEFHLDFEFKLERNVHLQSLAIFIGTVIGALLVVILIAISTNGDSMKQNYDERQERFRGKGANYAFCAMMFLNCILFILETAEAIVLPMTTGTGLMLSTMVGVGVYVVYCIWNEAYFALNQKSKVVVVSLIIVGVINLFIGIDVFRDGVAFYNNQLTVRSMNLFCAILMLVICGALILKKLCKDREEE